MTEYHIKQISTFESRDSNGDLHSLSDSKFHSHSLVDYNLVNIDVTTVKKLMTQDTLNSTKRNIDENGEDEY